MRDGSRYYGLLIEEKADAVVFRVNTPSGVRVVREFAADRVERIERSGQDTPPPVAPPPSAGDPASLTPADYEQMYREACELLADGDTAGARRALQRLVGDAPRDVLALVDRRAHLDHQRPLAHMLAELRLREALAEARRRGSFRLRGVTRYEGAALGELLESEIEQILKREYESRSIASWVEGEPRYATVTSETHKMVADVRLATAMIAARLRHDPRLRGSRDQAARLVTLRTALARFAAGVIALKGYTAGEPQNQDFLDILRRSGAGGTLLRRLTASSQPAASQPEDSAEPDRDPPAEGADVDHPPRETDDPIPGRETPRTPPPDPEEPDR